MISIEKQTSAPSHWDDILVEKHELMHGRPVKTECALQ